MKCIIVSCYKSYYYFLIHWINSILIAVLISLFDYKSQESQENNTNTRVTEELMSLLIEIGGDLLAGFLVLYTFLATDSMCLDNRHNNLNNEDSVNSNRPLKSMNRCTLIFLVSFIEFFNKSIYSILNLFYNKLKLGEYLWLISIIILSRIYFSHYILKIKLYKFHIVSLIIYLIGFSFMGILDFFAGDLDLEKWPYLLFIIIVNILNGLEDILIKILFTNKYLLPHSLMFWRGLYNLGMAIILFLILKVSGIEFIFPTKFDEYLIDFIALLIFFSQTFVVMKVIYIFTPQHVSFLNVSVYIGKLIYYRIVSNFSMIVFICEIIISLFMIFSTLIFSEMIIINKWGLNENTKKDLLTKEKKEFEDDENRISELIDRDEQGDKENKI